MSIGTHLVGALAGVTMVFGVTQGREVLHQAPPIHLTLAHLEYHEAGGVGIVTQSVASESGAPIPADWTVQISRPSESGALRTLCAGSSAPGRPGIYSGQMDSYTLDDWAGDDCPDKLRAGDQLEVSWTYKNEFGLSVSMGPGRGVYVVPAQIRRERAGG